jgi:hypothetical protein
LKYYPKENHLMNNQIIDLGNILKNEKEKYGKAKNYD